MPRGCTAVNRRVCGTLQKQDLGCSSNQIMNLASIYKQQSAYANATKIKEEPSYIFIERPGTTPHGPTYSQQNATCQTPGKPQVKIVIFILIIFHCYMHHRPIHIILPRGMIGNWVIRIPAYIRRISYLNKMSCCKLI